MFRRSVCSPFAGTSRFKCCLLPFRSKMFDLLGRHAPPRSSVFGSARIHEPFNSRYCQLRSPFVLPSKLLISVDDSDIFHFVSAAYNVHEVVGFVISQNRFVPGFFAEMVVVVSELELVEALPCPVSDFA